MDGRSLDEKPKLPVKPILDRQFFTQCSDGAIDRLPTTPQPMFDHRPPRNQAEPNAVIEHRSESLPLYLAID